MLKILRVSIFAVCLAAFGCQDAAKNYSVEYVDRSTVFNFEKKTNPLLLVVEIDAQGRLNLNKIQTGTISDSSVLSSKIEAIFEDRRNAGIVEREIFIKLQGTIKGTDLDKLIQSLMDVKAAPIRVIKNNLEAK